MPLGAGTRIGHYEILELIGAGGMGEVYRAHDPRLNRDVAVKVIPASFATDAERVTRFQQEARAAAALTHPNILAVHDVGTHDDTPFIVSELLAGMSLRQRLDAGPLPVRKAADIATQIARGLESAHQKGVVHRDLKPENLFVTDAGLVKILDFGLAKLIEPVPVSADTATVRAGTQPGTVMGTAGYMSPEQVRGQAVDHRTDIFAFGAVLYELLAGARAFRGETSMDVATAILKEDPPDLPAAERRIPPALTRIVDRCLEKNPSARFQSAGDLAFALDALSASSGVTTAMTAAPASDSRARGLSWLLPGVVGAALGIAGALGVTRLLAPAPPARVATVFPLTLPEGVSVASGAATGLASAALAPVAVSPDGRLIAVLTSSADGVRRLLVRSRSEAVPRALAGTEGALSPFWSPDSRHLAFFAGGKLKRVDVSGGAPVDVCDARNPLGGSWSPEGVIIFSRAGGGIQRVPESGGAATAVTRLAEEETNHTRPIFLPDGRRFLYRVLTADLAAKGSLYSASLDSTERTRLVETESSNTAYSAGHLLYLRGSTLMAHPFDAARGALTGDPFPIAEGIQTYGTAAVGVFSASPNGALVYQTGSTPKGSELTWFTREGVAGPRIGGLALQTDLRLSHDGTRLVVSRRSSAEATADIFIVDASTGAATRFTFDPGNEQTAVWSRDDRQIAFNSSKRGRLDLYAKPADGSSGERELLVDDQNKIPVDWSPDGRYLLYVVDPGSEGRSGRTGQRGRGVDEDGRALPWQRLWVLPLEGDRKPFPATPGDGGESSGQFSPDGRWIVYSSGDGRRPPAVYVVPFQSTNTKWQISPRLGTYPRWKGDEIFFLERDTPLTDRLSVARVDGRGPALRVVDVKSLFRVTPAGPRSFYAPAPDGLRILVNTLPPMPPQGPPTVVIDWPALRAGSK